MRYRKLDAAGDYTFGNRQNDFHRDTPHTVAQAVQTRLALFTGEWFLNIADGTPWRTEVLGKTPLKSVDMVIGERILGTPGVTRITRYTSVFNIDTRTLSMTAAIDTLYGPALMTTTL